MYTIHLFNLNSLQNELDVAYFIVENYERTSERFSLQESYDRAVCICEECCKLVTAFKID